MSIPTDIGQFTLQFEYCKVYMERDEDGRYQIVELEGNNTLSMDEVNSILDEMYLALTPRIGTLDE